MERTTTPPTRKGSKKERKEQAWKLMHWKILVHPISSAKWDAFLCLKEKNCGIRVTVYCTYCSMKGEEAKRACVGAIIESYWRHHLLLLFCYTGTIPPPPPPFPSSRTTTTTPNIPSLPAGIPFMDPVGEWLAESTFNALWLPLNLLHAVVLWFFKWNIKLDGIQVTCMSFLARYMSHTPELLEWIRRQAGWHLLLPSYSSQSFSDTSLPHTVRSVLFGSSESGVV